MQIKALKFQLILFKRKKKPGHFTFLVSLAERFWRFFLFFSERSVRMIPCTETFSALLSQIHMWMPKGVYVYRVFQTITGLRDANSQPYFLSNEMQISCDKWAVYRSLLISTEIITLSVQSAKHLYTTSNISAYVNKKINVSVLGTLLENELKNTITD